MPNPDPTQPKEFKEQKQKAIGLAPDVKLSRIPFSVRLPVEVDRALREMPLGSVWARDKLIEAYLKEFQEPAKDLLII